MSRKHEILLCGYYGFGNLGDELLARSLVDLAGSSGIPASRVALLSADPERSSDELGVTCFNRWSVPDVWRALRSSESLLLGGGGLFQDVTSWRSCLYYWGIIRMALLAGAKPWTFGQSVGPFKSRTGRSLAKNALSGCVVRGVRDQRSAESLKRWGMDNVLSPDPVLALSPPEEKEGMKKQGGTLLVNVRPWKENLADKIAVALESIPENLFPEIHFVALAPEDEALALRLVASSSLLKKRSRVERIFSWEEACRMWAGAGCAIGMRLHFCILSFIFSVPFVAVPYDPKVTAFAEDCGMECWQEGDLSFSTLCKKGFLGDNAGKKRQKVREVFQSCIPKIRGELQ